MALNSFKNASSLLVQLNGLEESGSLTNGTELLYNLALVNFEMQEYQSAIEYLDCILAKAYEVYP